MGKTLKKALNIIAMQNQALVYQLSLYQDHVNNNDFEDAEDLAEQIQAYQQFEDAEDEAIEKYGNWQNNMH